MSLRAIREEDMMIGNVLGILWVRALGSALFANREGGIDGVRGKLDRHPSMRARGSLRSFQTT